MFAETKVVKIYTGRISNMIEQAFEKYREADEMFKLVEEYKCLQQKFEDIRRFKKNKDFLYVNKFNRRFYYFRDSNNNPRITVCIIQDPKTKIYCRGISLCSFMDSPIKEFGRDTAEDRAIRAFKIQKSTEKISRSETEEIINSIQKFSSEFVSTHKSTYNAILTEFESKLFIPKK